MFKPQRESKLLSDLTDCLESFRDTNPDVKIIFRMFSLGYFTSLYFLVQTFSDLVS